MKYVKFVLISLAILSFSAASCNTADAPRDSKAEPGQIVNQLSSPNGQWRAETNVTDDGSLKTQINGANGNTQLPNTRLLAFDPDSKYLLVASAPQGLVSGLELIELQTMKRERITNRNIKDARGFSQDPTYLPLPLTNEDVSWSQNAFEYVVEGKRIRISLTGEVTTD